MKNEGQQTNGEFRRRVIAGTAIFGIAVLTLLTACDFRINGELIIGNTATQRPTYTITVTPYGYNPNSSPTSTFMNNRDVADTAIPLTQQAEATINAELTPIAP